MDMTPAKQRLQPAALVLAASVAVGLAYVSWPVVAPTIALNPEWRLMLSFFTVLCPLYMLALWWNAISPLQPSKPDHDVLVPAYTRTQRVWHHLNRRQRFVLSNVFSQVPPEADANDLQYIADRIDRLLDCVTYRATPGDVLEYLQYSSDVFLQSSSERMGTEALQRILDHLADHPLAHLREPIEARWAIASPGTRRMFHLVTEVPGSTPPSICTRLTEQYRCVFRRIDIISGERQETAALEVSAVLSGKGFPPEAGTLVRANS